MIIIQNMPVEQDMLIKEYSQNSIEREIINKLLKSAVKYPYDSLVQLKFEVNLRKEIIKASYDLYRSRMGFEVFRKSRCNPEFWDRTNEGGFVLKNGVKPSDAMNDIYANGLKYGTECATAMIILYYKAMLNIFLEEQFNKLFPKIHLMNWHYIDKLLKEVGYMIKPDDYLPGDRRYFTNPDVNPLTPEWQGENVIDLSNEKYYGHGIGIQKAEVMIRALNNERIKDADKSAFLLESVGRLNFKKLFKISFIQTIYL